MLTADAPAQPLAGSRTATLLHRATTDLTACTLTSRRAADRRTIALMLLDGTTLVAESVVDFEDTLGALRLELDQRDLLLACNRFRRDAFVDDEIRSATDGLGCYLVKPSRPPVQTTPARPSEKRHLKRW